MKAQTTGTRISPVPLSRSSTRNRLLVNLRPRLMTAGPVDHALTSAMIRDWLVTRRQPELVVALAGGAWPAEFPIPQGTRLVPWDDAVDAARGNAPEKGQPPGVGDGAVDLVLADGILNQLAYPDEYLNFCAELNRILMPHGRCIIRCFAQRQDPETKEDVFSDLSRGGIEAFDAFVWRLAMALQRNPRLGVSEEEIWNAVHDMWSNAERLAECYHWPLEEIQVIEAYRESARRYSFPTVAEHESLFSSCGFVVTQTAYPVYELGERCPTLILDRAPPAPA